MIPERKGGKDRSQQGGQSPSIGQEKGGTSIYLREGPCSVFSCRRGENTSEEQDEEGGKGGTRTFDIRTSQGSGSAAKKREGGIPIKKKSHLCNVKTSEHVKRGCNSTGRKRWEDKKRSKRQSVAQ